jgi:shikimate dehydrogenase
LIQQALGKTVRIMSLDNLSEGLKDIDIMVNTTSIGMFPQDKDTLVPASFLPGIPVVVDVVYNPLKTRLLKEAKKAGAKTIGGLDMLVWQGALAFEKWTGRKAPFKLMRCEALKALWRL